MKLKHMAMIIDWYLRRLHLQLRLLPSPVFPGLYLHLLAPVPARRPRGDVVSTHSTVQAAKRRTHLAFRRDDDSSVSQRHRSNKTGNALQCMHRHCSNTVTEYRGGGVCCRLCLTSHGAATCGGESAHWYLV